MSELEQLRQSLIKAAGEVNKLKLDATVPQYEFRRLLGKEQGINLAISYIEQMLRERA